MAKTVAKTLIETPFPSTNRVAKKLKLPKSRVRSVEGMMELIHKNKVNSSKHSSKKRSKNLTMTSRAIERIGPPRAQTDARRIANFFKMAKTKDIQVAVRALKRTEAQGIKAFVKKAE